MNNQEHQEWKFWHKNGKCPAPKNWDCVSKQNDILLDPREQVPLLFKFYSFREASTDRDEDELKNVLRPRTV